MINYPNISFSFWRLVFLSLLTPFLSFCSNLPVEQKTPYPQTSAVHQELQKSPYDKQIHLAKSLLSRGLLEQAEQALETINPRNIQPEQRIQYHALKSSLFMQAGNLLESAQQRTVLDTLILDKNARIKNQQALLDTLLLLSSQSLSFLEPSFNAPLAGWMKLALVIKQHQPSDALDPSLDLWRKDHPSHPANTGYLSSLLQQQKTAYKPPQKVAVFLPSQGPVSGVADSIRKGVLSASFSLKKRWQPNLTFYDTSKSSITELYQQAVTDGVNVIIGPLEKANVSKLTQINNLSIPTIALNKPTGLANEKVFFFSLSPEEEASQVASLAWLDGHQGVLIMTPESNFGRRVASHFSTIWQQFGGKVLGTQTYPVKQADYSSPIKSLLRIDDSIARHKRLQKKLNLGLSFEERRRHDADFIFLIAKPREGRLIKPQLRFHRALSLPVYSTSKIHQGKLNKVANRDLEGLKFCDMPWVIDPEISNDLNPRGLIDKWTSIPQSHQRYFSFGLDAYQIIPHLQRLTQSPSNKFRGESGILAIDKEHRISRQLNCAVFKHGIAKPIGLAPALDTALPLPIDPKATMLPATSSYSTPLP